MKNIARLLAVSAFVLATAMNIGAVLAKDHSPSSVLVDNGSFRCTAFSIGDGLFVTAGHCLGPIVNGDGKQFNVIIEGKSYPTQVVLYSNEELGMDDFAVLRASATVPPLWLGCFTDPKPGDSIEMSGFPGGYVDAGPITVRGYVAGRPTTWTPYWRRPGVPINIAAQGGFSGAPVLNEYGAVVGILVGGIPEQRSLAFMTPIKRVCQALGWRV